MTITVSDFNYIRKIVRDRAGLLLAEDKVYLVESRLTRLAKEEGLNSIGGLVAYLRQNPLHSLYEMVVEALMTNETFFFRDERPFNALKTAIVPELIEKRKKEQTLNIWCAACSSGQEPYSIAMLLQEYFPQLNHWKIHLFASDISTTILERARAGCYGKHEINRGLPPSFLKKYFHALGSEWQIKDSIRRMVEFRQLNLTTPFPSLPSMDIIFLRNVLIYFDPETKQAILARVRQVLQPDGYLFLGGGETTINLDDCFEPVQVDKVVCYRLR